MKRWIAAIGFVLATCAIVRAQGASQDKIFSRQKAFRIPFQIPDPAEQKQLKEVQLYVATNGGKWEKYTASPPDVPADKRFFTFRTDKDGEFCFAVRTMDTRGNLIPDSDAAMTVGLRVVVDSEVPRIDLRSASRGGREVGVEWEVADRNLDLDTLRLEYRSESQETWQSVPGVVPKFVGQATWTPEVAGRISVRCQVQDKAQNLGIQSIELQTAGGNSRTAFDTRPSNTDTGPAMKAFNRQPEVPVATENAGPTFPSAGRNGINNNANNAPALTSDGPGRSPFGRSPSIDPRTTAPFSDPLADEPATQSPGRSPLPPSSLGARSAPPAAAPMKPANRQIVNDSELSLDYSIEDEGPSGVSVIELYMTTDLGRTWKRIGDDPDRQSPFTINLAGEGIYGLSLVAKSGVGLGDRPPIAGDQPQMWVEVDKTAPHVQLDTPEVGKGPQAGNVIINWQADDGNLGDRCVSLYYTEIGKNDWKPITAGVENTGRYIWKMGPQTPFRFRVAIEVSDMAGNREMQESAEVTIDMSKPKPKISGVNTGKSLR